MVIQDTKTLLYKALSTCPWCGIAHVVVNFLLQVILVFLCFEVC